MLHRRHEVVVQVWVSFYFLLRYIITRIVFFPEGSIIDEEISTADITANSKELAS